MPRTSGQTKFVVDAMLGSLSRKLRVFGFDTAYYKDGDDAGLLALARRQRRTIVTADRSLAARSGRRSVGVLLVVGGSDYQRLAGLVKAAEREGLALRRGEPRCSLCNGRLARIPASKARSLVQPAVAMRHRSFYRCVNCGQLYWRGGHWKKLRRFRRLFASGS